MHSRWSRRVALGIVSVLTASFAFVGFVEGPSGATGVITQTSPTSGTVSTTASGTYTTQLVTSPVATNYVVTAPNANLIVSPSGAITTHSTLPVGTYQVAGTDTDSSSDTGAWTFSLSVTAVTITQSSPTSGTVTTTASSAYANQLVTVGNGTVSYVVTAPNTNLIVSPSGAITTHSTLPVGTYQIAGTDSDSSGDTSGGWTFSLTVTAGHHHSVLAQLGHGNEHGVERLRQPVGDRWQRHRVLRRNPVGVFGLRPSLPERRGDNDQWLECCHVQRGRDRCRFGFR